MHDSLPFVRAIKHKAFSDLILNYNFVDLYLYVKVSVSKGPFQSAVIYD